MFLNKVDKSTRGNNIYVPFGNRFAKAKVVLFWISKVFTRIYCIAEFSYETFYSYRLTKNPFCTFRNVYLKLNNIVKLLKYKFDLSDTKTKTFSWFMQL